MHSQVCPSPAQGTDVGEERDVYHFWHTAWCDFGELCEGGRDGWNTHTLLSLVHSEQ